MQQINKDLVIGDLHFGVKSNSITWLESQIKFFDEQIFKVLDTEDFDRIVFLGDLFDIRYAINQQIGIEVKKLIRRLAKRFTKNIYLVAGNHDYYSPLEEFDEYNAYELVFGEEFVSCYPNLKIINHEPLLEDDGTLFLPWYYTENPEHFDTMLYNYKMGIEVTKIYCHTDLSIWPGARITSLKGIPVYSGHIHYPYNDELGNLHNIGAALSLTFNDVNSFRYLYVIEGDKIIKKIKNITTPTFKRFYNEKIFDLHDSDFNNSYVQLCVSTSNINTAKYIEQIKELKNTYVCGNVRINIVDDDESEDIIETGEGFNTNINKYIDNNIPEHLSTKYEYIKNKLIQEHE